MKVEQFDHVNVNEIAKEVVAALQSIAEKHGINLKKGRGTFDRNNWTMKLEWSIVAKNGTPNTKEKTDLDRFGVAMGLPANSYGKEFTYSGSRFKVVGLKVSSHKYPIIGERVSTGKRYKFSVDAVTRMFI